MVIWSFIKKNNIWFFAPEKKDYLAVSAMGTSYTAYSEILNVVLRESWSYAPYSLYSYWNHSDYSMDYPYNAYNLYMSPPIQIMFSTEFIHSVHMFICS